MFVNQANSHIFHVATCFSGFSMRTQCWYFIIPQHFRFSEVSVILVTGRKFLLAHTQVFCTFYNLEIPMCKSHFLLTSDQ